MPSSDLTAFSRAFGDSADVPILGDNEGLIRPHPRSRFVTEEDSQMMQGSSTVLDSLQARPQSVDDLGESVPLAVQYAAPNIPPALATPAEQALGLDQEAQPTPLVGLRKMSPAQRTRLENMGISSMELLADTSPSMIARTAKVDEDRAREWRSAAQTVVRAQAARTRQQVAQLEAHDTGSSSAEPATAAPLQQATIQGGQSENVVFTPQEYSSRPNVVQQQTGRTQSEPIVSSQANLVASSNHQSAPMQQVNPSTAKTPSAHQNQSGQAIPPQNPVSIQQSQTLRPNAAPRQSDRSQTEPSVSKQANPAAPSSYRSAPMQQVNPSTTNAQAASQVQSEQATPPQNLVPTQQRQTSRPHVAPQQSVSTQAEPSVNRQANPAVPSNYQSTPTQQVNPSTANTPPASQVQSEQVPPPQNPVSTQQRQTSRPNAAPQQSAKAQSEAPVSNQLSAQARPSGTTPSQVSEPGTQPSTQPNTINEERSSSTSENSSFFVDEAPKPASDNPSADTEDGTW
jgi:hypothetical protein